MEDFRGDEILNQRGEWGCNLPPNIMVEGEAPNPKRKGREIPQAGEEFKEHKIEDDTRPKRSKIPRTIIEDLITNKTRDRNSPKKEKGITPTEQNANDQAIEIMAKNVKLEPILTTFEVDEEQGETTVNRLDDYEEERLAVQGPSNVNAKVNRASKVYEVKYSKNGQVQTYNPKKAEHPSKKGKPKTKKSTPISGKKSCKYKVQTTDVQNPTGVQSTEGFQGPIGGQSQACGRNPADDKVPTGIQEPSGGQSPTGGRNPAGVQSPTTSVQSPTRFQVFRSTVSGFQGQTRDQDPAGGRNPASGQNLGFQETEGGQSSTGDQNPAGGQNPAGFQVSGFRRQQVVRVKQVAGIQLVVNTQQAFRFQVSGFRRQQVVRVQQMTGIQLVVKTQQTFRFQVSRDSRWSESNKCPESSNKCSEASRWSESSRWSGSSRWTGSRRWSESSMCQEWAGPAILQD